MGKGRKRKNITPFKDFERTVDNGAYQTNYIRLVHIQLVCMNELSASAFRLYVMMKDYAKGESEFEFPYRIYKNFLSKQTFTTARQELVDKGYIEPFLSYKNMRKANKYRFSSHWKELNKDTIKEIVERESIKNR